MTPTTPDPYSRASAPDPHSSTPAADPHSPAPATDTMPGFQHWGRVYAFVLAFLALLIALFAWLTRIYS